ncbi:aconitase family protein, partial [Francisella tularensis]|uniref:aconitase family protein n=1 Tax=Francisella tularensis TaxID=263 RepID=UPI002381BF26
IGIGGTGGYVIYYVGQEIKDMTLEESRTICNMSIECGARAGLVSTDEKTFSYLKGIKYAPQGYDFDKSVEFWNRFIC